MSVEETC